MALIIAELFVDGECIARWTDEDGPSNLAQILPSLERGGWIVHDFRVSDRPAEDEEQAEAYPTVTPEEFNAFTRKHNVKWEPFGG
jgi:hypothetical protein